MRKLQAGMQVVSGTPGRVMGMSERSQREIDSGREGEREGEREGGRDRKMLTKDTDMINRRSLATRAIKVLVLDEADEMLNKGFKVNPSHLYLIPPSFYLLLLKEQIYEIYRHLPPGTQVVVVSATLTREVLEITRKFTNDPVRVLVRRDEITLEGIKQV